jgi:AcrR family transcriptional regulator
MPGDASSTAAAAADPGRTLALLWGAQDRPGRSGLTVRAIVDAAVQLADASGIAAVSMRAVADRLGAGTMSLYTHVPGKPALLELMIDRVAGELYADLEEPRDQPGDWREAVRFIARRNWEAFLKHPWLLSVADGRPVLGPNISRKYEAELRPLDGIGLSDLEMDSVLTLVLVHVEGLARWQVALQSVRAERGESDADWWTKLEPALVAVMDASAFPTSGRVGRAVGEYHQSAGEPAHQLDFGIERILDGVDALIAGRSRPSSDDPLIAGRSRPGQ